MKWNYFQNLKEIEDLTNYQPDNENETFLFGENLIEQKINKKVGDQISYYIVTKIKSNNDFSYKQKFDILEK